jgi:hypothetical protein
MREVSGRPASCPRVARSGEGVVRVAKYITAISSWFWDGMDVRWVTTNGQASVVLVRNGDVFGVLTVTASAAGIDHLLWMVNPEKIAAVA